MNTSHFSLQVLSAVPTSTRQGLQKLEYDFLKMKHSKFSAQQFEDEIERSIRTFALVLDETICKEGGNSLILSELESAEDAIEFISNAITNRLQSSRYLYEAGLFDPHNMGSVAKLYGFYESFLDLFESLIVNREISPSEPGPNTKLNFLVDISTHSSIHAQLFVPLTCNPIPAHRLIGITVNENAFLQVKNTIIYLLHEIGHYVRPYSRRKRNEVVKGLLIDWIGERVYHEMLAYLFSEVDSTYGEGKTSEEKAAFTEVRKHFEDILTGIIPIAKYILIEYFEAFTSSPTTRSSFKLDNPYLNQLSTFQALLDRFLIDCSGHLSKALFWPEDELDAPGIDIRDEIDRLLNALDQYTLDAEEDVTYFAFLCSQATSLFEIVGPYAYTSASGNSRSSPIIEYYITSLSTLGLNEESPYNLGLFSKELIKCLKRSIEETLRDNVLDMIVTNFDEALANMFWIRTLDIKDFQSYWEIAQSLIDRTIFHESDRIRYFGIPNAIITEYFDLLKFGRPQEKQTYTIPPIIPVENPTTHNRKSSTTVNQGVIEYFRHSIFIPVARYLIEAKDVFPEDGLFKISPKGPTSNDGKRIAKLRELFRPLLNKSKNNNSQFMREIEMINFFKKTV